MRPLFLFAHQDDEFGVFAALAKHCREENSPLCIYLTNGETEKADSSVRNSESLAALSRLGVKETDIVFLGTKEEIPDGQLYRHLETAIEALESLTPEIPKEKLQLYIPAWEGGHQDHDAAHLIGMALAKKMGADGVVYQYSLYHGENLPRPFFKVLSPIKLNGPTQSIPVTFSQCLKFLRLILLYRSQVSTWIGLAPFVALKLLFRRKQDLQAVDIKRCTERPHIGPLLYEKRGRGTFDDNARVAEPFIQKWLSNSISQLKHGKL